MSCISEVAYSVGTPDMARALSEPSLTSQQVHLLRSYIKLLYRPNSQ